MSGPQRIIAGAMSGTSADGVDVAITAIAGRGLEMSATLIQHHHRPYDPPLKKHIFECREKQTIGLGELAKMGREISLAYSQTIQETLAVSRLNASDLTAIAAHGQTLFHDPPSTIQWLDPALIAADVGCQVISDFRRADCAAGGQGAPLVPFADFILFRHPTKNRALLNIGGIANVTLLNAKQSIDKLIAFDTGPGNCISDWICRQLDPSGNGFDANGELANRGEPLGFDLRQRFYADPFFSQPPPKSTDPTRMIAVFQNAFANWKSIPIQNLLATACELTAQIILGSLGNFRWDELIVSGGGIRNRALMRGLQNGTSAKVIISDDLGVPSEAKEAIAFALLGATTLDGIASNVPSVTGAKRAVVLGSITPKP